MRAARTFGAGALVLAGALAPVAAAQAPAAADSQSLRVWLMTMGPGDAVWERFGHNAIRIRNPRNGEDRVYNWGMFSLDDSGFIWRFLQGRMRYWMASEDAALTVEFYRQSNRSVTLQELDLSDVQKEALYDFVRRNELPQNRYYDYDYFRDNCSTRVRDALDFAAGGAIARHYAGRRTDLTYRDHARRLMQPDMLAYAGIDVGLGRPTDYPLTPWEEMFIPMSLQRLIRDVAVRDAQGNEKPLLLSERVIFEAQRSPPPERPEARLHWFLLAGVLAGGVMVVAAITGARRLAGGIGITWCVIAGILGTLLVFLWAVTDHTAAHNNANLFTLNPLWLALAVLFARAGRVALLIALGLFALALAGWLWLLLPVENQQDTSRVLALTLPLHAAVVIVQLRRHGVPRRA